MNKRPSENSRMRQAVVDASNLHDGAFRDPAAMAMLATQYRVDITELVRRTKVQVAESLKDEAEHQRPAVLEGAWEAYDFGDLVVFRADDWEQTECGLGWQRQAILEDAAGSNITALTFVVRLAGDGDNTILSVDAWETYDETRQTIGQPRDEAPALDDVAQPGPALR